MNEKTDPQAASVDPFVIRFLDVLETVHNEKCKNLQTQVQCDSYAQGWCDAVDEINRKVQPLLDDVEHLQHVVRTLLENTGVDCQGGNRPIPVEFCLLEDVRHALGGMYVLNEDG